MLALPTDLHSLIGISPIFFRGKYGTCHAPGENRNAHFVVAV